MPVLPRRPPRKPSLPLALGLFALWATGCFALFSLDGYGPPSGDQVDDAGDAQPGNDARADVSTVDAYVRGRFIFVTRDTFTGNLGGLDGGNDKCRLAAADAGLTGTFEAVLSDVTTDGGLALARAAGPLRLVTSELVADGGAQLLRPGPHAISVDEHGATVPSAGECEDGGLVAWTGTFGDGGWAGSAYDCSSWQSGPSGIVGLVRGGDGGVWLAACTKACNGRAALYCIER